MQDIRKPFLQTKTEVKEDPGFLKQEQAREQPSFTAFESMSAAAELADMNDRTSQVLNLLENLGTPKANKMNPEELNKVFPNMSRPFVDPTTYDDAKRIYDRDQKRKELQYIISRGPDTKFSNTLKFLGGIAGGISTIDIAASVAIGGFVHPFKSNFWNTFASNSIENIALEPVSILSERQDLQQYQLDDAFENSVGNAIMYQGLYAGALGLKKGLSTLFNKSKFFNKIQTSKFNAATGKDITDDFWKSQPEADPNIRLGYLGVPDITNQMRLEIDNVPQISGEVSREIRRDSYFYREVDYNNLADRTYYTNPEPGLQLDAPLSLFHTGGKFLFDNPKANDYFQSETTGLNKFKVEEVNLKNMNLLNTNVKLVDLEPKMLSKLKSWFPEIYNSLDNKATLEDLLNEIDFKSKRDPNLSAAEYSRYDTFFKELSGEYDGLVFKSTDHASPTNGVLLFDAAKAYDPDKVDTLKHSVYDASADYMDMFPTSALDTLSKDIESYKTDFSYDPRYETTMTKMDEGLNLDGINTKFEAKISQDVNDFIEGAKYKIPKNLYIPKPKKLLKKELESMPIINKVTDEIGSTESLGKFLDKKNLRGLKDEAMLELQTIEESLKNLDPKEQKKMLNKWLDKNEIGPKFDKQFEEMKKKIQFERGVMEAYLNDPYWDLSKEDIEAEINEMTAGFKIDENRYRILKEAAYCMGLL